MLVLVICFFFFRQISDFYLAIFDGIFKISFEKYCCLELKISNISPVIISLKIMELKIAIMANLGQLTRDLFCASNA